MTNTNTGGPAFPSDHDNEYGYPAKGMTLRDYFAAKAMQNVFNTGCDDDERRYIAMHAYKMADAMLKVVIQNYSLYYQCAEKTHGWQDWYGQQKKIHESANK